jgi:glucose-6-phosphate isomerase
MSDTATLLEQEAGAMVRRLFAKDPTLWVDDPRTPEVADRLGWLDAPQRYERKLGELVGLVDQVKGSFDRVVLLGMGGSSLAPEVFAKSFRRRPGSLALVVLDTTHPDAIAAALEGGGAELARTLFIVASKSGTTIESCSLNELCWEKTGQRGGQFIAITDPGTVLAQLAQERGFLRCFENDPAIGGRFSALSYFGLVPAALIGVPLTEVLERAATVATRDALAAKEGRAHEVSGAPLAAHLAANWRGGRDKLTLATTPGYGAFGVWMEQLVAESTGKQGKGIVPIVDEPMVPRALGEDRLYVTMVESGMAVDLPPGADAGSLPGLHRLDLGAQFYTWEIATALAGAWMRVNPFDQPNVQESKAQGQEALKATKAAKAARAAEAGEEERVQGLEGVESALKPWLESLRPGDYAAILAYLPPTQPNDGYLNRIRKAILLSRGVATTLGYGPRYLHSTGQLHKGGKANGVFLQIETSPSRDIQVPGSGGGHTFGQLIQAQATGDYRALTARDRRVLRVRLRPGELERLAQAMEEVCA